jgi:hypothetical protein
MSIDERNDVLDIFRTVSDILISTDTGGEGLNLQFSNCVINYDLPWNPMKIEQRIGRVDRIGQQRDVIAYNFILTDTIEARVREVLEEKLAAILKELGVDKYADVLDGEAAEINFTAAYMRSIQNPKNIKYAASAVEDDFKRQVDNTIKIKELISDPKDLHALAGADSGFDLDASLRAMLAYYELGAGNPVPPIERYSISDPRITRHLSAEIEFSAYSHTPVLVIRDFPNEKGYFLLWELSVSSDQQSRRFIPIFINDDLILRPLAGRKIWDAILDDQNALTVTGSERLSSELLEDLTGASRDYAYNAFITWKEDTEKRRDETFRKYMYALNLRIDAAGRIGIENIRDHKLSRLAMEKTAAEKDYLTAKAIFPEFKPVLIVRMEDSNAKQVDKQAAPD